MGNIARDEAERPVRRVRRVPLMECCGVQVGCWIQMIWVDFLLDRIKIETFTRSFVCEDGMWISWIGISDQAIKY